MTAPTYTVQTDDRTPATGLTAEQAAAEILSYDGDAFELRSVPDDRNGLYWTIWTRQQVANRRWGPTLFSCYADTESEAWARLAREVIDRSAREYWRGPWATREPIAKAKGV